MIAPAHSPPSIPALLAEFGGSDAEELGIALDGLQPEAVYQWFLAAVLYGARISRTLATRAWREFVRCGVLTPQKMVDTGWDGLVAMLDRGGYARYDYKTATKLLEVNNKLLADYDGDLNALHARATDASDLEQRVMALGKGIGPVTVDIFLRELRGRWDKATLPLSPPAYAAALELGLLPAGTLREAALPRLQQLWQLAGKPACRFCELEAALVHAGLRRQCHGARRAP